MIACLLAVTLLTLEQGETKFSIDASSAQVDFARSTEVTLRLEQRGGNRAALPDISSRLVGFSVNDSYSEAEKTDESGLNTQVLHLQLVPKAAEKEYKIKPFAVAGMLAKAVYFSAPEEPSEVPKEMSLKIEKDPEPFSWKKAGRFALFVGLTAIMLLVGFFALRHLVRALKERKMTPYERALTELGKLMKRSLPAKGKYKDYYVELTRIVRRYVERKYGFKATKMTTEEFLNNVDGSDALGEFFESADMIKFAGVEATEEIAENAASYAKAYFVADNRHNKGTKA